MIRDYIYISDPVDLCMRAGESSVTGVFNAGGGVGYSLREILKMVERVSGSAPPMEYRPGRAFDVKKIILDNSRAIATYCWTPRVRRSKRALLCTCGGFAKRIRAARREGNR